MTEVGRATAVLDVDDSRLNAGLLRARQSASAAISGIEQDANRSLSNAFAGIGGGLQQSFSRGSFRDIGKTLGQDLVQGITAPLGSMSSAAASAATALGPVGIAAVAGTVAVAGLGVASSKAAMEWEAGMSQISKTTGIEKGTAAFKELDSNLLNLYSRMPTTVSEIQSVAAAAGSLGIEKASIAGFTEVALQMGSAFDMPAEEAATAIGKIKGQLKSLPEGAKDSTDFARQFGSAVDYVGNNFNATERDVLDFSTRVAGSMSSLGAGAYEIAGWGGMLSSVFPSAERAAGSFDALLTQLTTNEDAQAKAAELLGVSTEEFMQAMSTDPSDTLLRIGSALEALPADQLLSVTKTLGGSYGMDALNKMIGHTDEWRKSIEDTVRAGQKGESIGDSFSASANNMKAQLQILGNSVGAIFKDIGGPINAALTPVISSVAGSLNSVRQIGENLWEPFVAGMTPAISGVTTLAGLIGQLGGNALSGLVEGSKQVNAAFQTGKAYVTAFVEELQNMAASNSTIQTMGSAFDQFKNKLGEISEFWGDVSGKIVSGLSSAIPQALSGATGAIGSLIGQGLDAVGLGGVGDTASGLLSGVSNFWDRVSQRAKEKLGLATEEAVEDGTKTGMEKGAQDAKPGVAGAVADAVDEAYWSAAISRQRAGISQAKAYSLEAQILATGAPVVSSSGRNKWELAAWASPEVREGNVTYSMRYTPSPVGGYYTLTRTLPSGKKEEIGRYNITSDIGRAKNEASIALSAMAGDIVFSPENAATLANIPFTQNVQATVSGSIVDIASAINSEIESTGDLINQSLADNWFDPEALEAAAGRLKDLKLFDPEEFARQGGDNALAYIQAINEKLESLEAAKVRLEADPDDEQARAEVQRLIGDLQLFAEQNPLIVRIDGDNRPLLAKVMEAYYKGEDLAKLGISNLERFQAYTFEQERQSLKTYLESGLAPLGDSELYQSLYYEYQQLVSNYDKLNAIDQQYTLALGKALHEGGAAWQELGQLIRIELDDIGSSSQQVQEAQAASASAIDKTAESMNTWCEAASDFAYWQETAGVAAGMFYKSFIGSTEDYNKWMDESGEAARRAGVSGATPVKLDTTEAEGQWAKIKGEITTEQQTPLKIDDTQAMSAIAAIEAAASAPVIKPVYVVEYGGGGGNVAPGWVGDMGFDPSTWIPAFGEGDVFVPEPTLAIVGDRPGGEWIGGIDQARARFGGGTGTVININVTVNGDVTGEALIEHIKNEAVKEVGYLMNRGGSA